MTRATKTEHASVSSKKTQKKRLDQLLVAKGLAENRTRAQALIMSEVVIVNDKRIDKPGTCVPVEVLFM